MKDWKGYALFALVCPELSPFAFSFLGFRLTFPFVCLNFHFWPAYRERRGFPSPTRRLDELTRILKPLKCLEDPHWNEWILCCRVGLGQVRVQIRVVLFFGGRMGGNLRAGSKQKFIKILHIYKTWVTPVWRLGALLFLKLLPHYPSSRKKTLLFMLRNVASLSLQAEKYVAIGKRKNLKPSVKYKHQRECRTRKIF